MPTKRSPIQHLLEKRQPEWGDIGGMPIALRFTTDAAERAVMQSLGLCDISGLRKLGVKGRDAASWLADEGVDVPAEVYQSRHISDGGRIVRLGSDEFLLESGIADTDVRSLDSKIGSSSGGVFRIERQDATFLLVGTRALEVLAQTCAINFRDAAEERLVLTSVAAVSCGVLPDASFRVPAYRLWIDPSFAVYLWERLAEICESLGGSSIGAACIFPELLSMP